MYNYDDEAAVIQGIYSGFFAVMKNGADKLEEIFDAAGILKNLWRIETDPTVTPDTLRRIKSAYTSVSNSKEVAVIRAIQVAADTMNVLTTEANSTYCLRFHYAGINSEKRTMKYFLEELEEFKQKIKTSNSLFSKAQALTKLHEILTDYQNDLKDDLDEDIYILNDMDESNRLYAA